MLPAKAAALIARQLADVHRAAQERLGLTGALIVYQAWEKISITAPVLTVEFAAGVVKIVRALRQVSRRLAARYYNLIRALGSGHAYPDVDRAFAHGTTTLQTLYAALAQSINEVATATSLDITPDVPASKDVQPTTDSRPLTQRLDDLESALVHMFKATFPPSADLRQDIAVEDFEDGLGWPELGNEEAMDHELLAEIQTDSIDELRKAVDKELTSQRTMAAGMARVTDRADVAGATAASLVDAEIMTPGRRLIFMAGNRDPRRYAWMRVTGPHPCAFCSMLASRGAVYHTAESAGYGNLYHPRCKCSQTAVFVKEPHYSARDQYFIDNWPTVTFGYSGQGALKVWRTWLSQQYAKGLVPEQDIFGPAAPAAA